MFLMGKIMSPRDFEMHQGKTFKSFTNKMNSRAQDTLFFTIFKLPGACPTSFYKPCNTFSVKNIMPCMFWKYDTLILVKGQIDKIVWNKAVRLWILNCVWPSKFKQLNWVWQRILADSMTSMARWSLSRKKNKS